MKKQLNKNFKLVDGREFFEDNEKRDYQNFFESYNKKNVVENENYRYEESNP